MKKAINEPPKLSGIFEDKTGKVMFEIRENEWIGNQEAWDIESVGNILKIKDQKNSILLQIKAKPPHIVAIQIANLKYGNSSLITNEETGQITIATNAVKHINSTAGFIVTYGPILIQNGSVSFQNGSIIALGQDGMKMNALDFDKYLQTEQVVSVSS
jgi:hypothetical protein